MKQVTVIKCKAGTSNYLSWDTGTLADLSKKYAGQEFKSVKAFRKALDKGVDRNKQDYFEVI